MIRSAYFTYLTTGRGAMLKREVPVHYLRPNESVWTPPALISLDTEATTTIEGDNEALSLRLWSARYTDRRPPKGKSVRDEREHGESGEDLAYQVHLWTKDRRTVWVYAHNLHFDLTTSNLVDELRNIGWTVTDFAVDGSSPFVRMERKDHHLTICDSFSWLPVRLEDIGPMVGIIKPPLPAEGDDKATWFYRCDQDTEILHEAMLILMAWWDDNQLGRWSVTGGASGWNVMRHIPADRKILIDPDPVKVAADREAIYGGWRGQWRAGQLAPGRYSELDLERAYTTVCAELPLPCERMVAFDSLPVQHPWITSDRHGILAKVRISTDTPRWPCKIDNRVWYPVGEFWTVLAGPDIAEAARLGCLREIGAGHMHKLGAALRPWARWCLDAQREDNASTPDVAKITLKHWGRTCVGKWAQRGFTRVQLGQAPGRGWDCQEGWNHSAGVRASIVDFGGIRWQVTASGDCENAYPAILAWVEAYVRVALGRAIDIIGDDAMVCCDTDGMIVNVRKLAGDKRFWPAPQDPAAHWGAGVELAINLASRAAAPLRLREKRTYHNVAVVGPQHVTLDDKRRFAGVPASAEPTPDGKLWARLWPKLAWQMRHGRAGTFIRPAQEYKIAGTYAPGWVTSDGLVRPVETYVDAGGATCLTRWPLTRHAAAGAQLAYDQNRALERYRHGPIARRPAENHARRGQGRGAHRQRANARAP